MRAELLHVVTAISNPARWKSRIRLYKDFEQHMLDSGVKLTVVECAYGDRPHELGDNPHVNYVPVHASGHHLVWNKEPLLNIGISRIPDAKYIATLDADIEFRRGDWASETVHALQHYHVVQPWTHCSDLGPQGEPLQTHVSFCKLWHERKELVQGPAHPYGGGAQFGHPGYAWAWTRQALDWAGGLIETAALGAADHHMAMGMIGRVQDSIHGGMTEGYKAPLFLWQKRAHKQIQGNIGCVAGTIEHFWHGPKDKRAYISRWDILAKHKFDPANDLKRNTYGVLELAGNKPELAHDIDVYFRTRDEDANTAG
jgi:hypothetical protein